MTDKLTIKAGKTALAHIRERGLAPEDITAVLGASGAAKWLSIYGLDRAVFSRWLHGITHQVSLLGSSIGAWKLAAAAQEDPGRAFDRLRDAYISQTYRGRVTPEKITDESLKILNRFIPRETIPGILSHPYIKLGFLSVRCRGLMAEDNTPALGAGILAGYLLNLATRRTQAMFFNRVLFRVPGAGATPFNINGFGAEQVALDMENFYRALLSSGSIPVVMDGIRDIPGARAGVYRDGGILDYHPLFSLKHHEPGFILYPHFYPHIIPGWFDKTMKRRRAVGEMADRVILVSPSPDFVSQLPYGRIPDRKDFLRFRGNDRERYRAWHAVAVKSLELGDAFLDAVASGRIRKMAAPL
ncbi:MAG: patatin-like phospholipase family protein [Desulfobacter sp.]|nr:MAG: patatin-like phospholipase family protein [Desulfobacter sp.]